MQAVNFSLRSSRKLLIFSVALCLLMTYFIWLSDTPFFLKAGISLVMGCYFRKILRLHIQRECPQSIIMVWQNSKGQWGLKTKSGYCALGTLKNSSFVSTWLIILRFRCISRSVDVLIPADALSSLQYRVLSTRIRFF